MLDGNKLRDLRIEKGYTSEDLSKIAKVSKSYIEELERQSKINPSFAIVERIANGLSVKIDDIRKVG
jgi:transcriptional regulator with XRE-family HTH domain